MSGLRAAVIGAGPAGSTAARLLAERGDLRAYDRRLRLVLSPALGRLDAIARAAEVSITAALLAVRLSQRVRERAVDAIVGRGPFGIDGNCELACVCNR